MFWKCFSPLKKTYQNILSEHQPIEPCERPTNWDLILHVVLRWNFSQLKFPWGKRSKAKIMRNGQKWDRKPKLVCPSIFSPRATSLRTYSHFWGVVRGVFSFSSCKEIRTNAYAHRRLWRMQNEKKNGNNRRKDKKNYKITMTPTTQITLTQTHTRKRREFISNLVVELFVVKHNDCV